MITVISPAKKLSEECNAVNTSFTQPSYLDRSGELVSQLKNYDPTHLQGLMGISEKLSTLNWERYQSWKTPFNKSNSRQALFTFKGDTYSGLDADTLSKNEITYSQNHTRILSGLYGLLKPLDLIMPYRLEMGTKLENSSGKNLYEFWGSSLAEYLEEDLSAHSSKFVVNCASVEYFRSIDNDALKSPVITPIFKEIKNGKPKIISFFAKKARGMMARYIIQNQIENPHDIQKFNVDGYSFDEGLSSEFEPVFTRAQA
tara:strand:+ start:84 stop:857 length:774 start_codon:yes stop_codon:yes gene_type:complete